MSVNIGTIEGIIRLNDQFSAGIDKAAGKLRSFANDSISLLNRRIGIITPIAAAGIFAGVGLAVKEIYDNVSEAQQALAQLEAGVKSTGGAAGRSAEQLVEMSGSLQKLSGVSDEAIQRGQAVLLTFTKIGRDAFPIAIQASLDLSRRLGTDLSSSALQVGKALNDPIKGVTALSRAGVQFSEAQKTSIKSLVEHGKVAEAQKIVLRELELQVGGSAEAFRNTLPGAIAALSNAWGDLLEEVGKSGEGGGLFRTAIEGMVSSLEYLKENWFALESAVFTVLGNTSSALVKWGALAVGVVEKFAIAQQSVQNLIPDFLGFGLAGKAQGLADRAVSTLAQTKKDLLQLADDLKSGFGDKAEEALERGIVPAKGLDSSLKGLANTIGELSGDALKLAKDLAALSAELIRSASFNRKLAAAFNLGASKEQIDSIKRAHTLHEAYLKDVEKFGKSAAASLQLLRAADYDAKKAAEAAKETYEKLGEAVAEAGRLAGEGFSDSLSDRVKAGLEGMERDAQEVLRRLDLKKDLEEEFSFAIRVSAIDDTSPHLASIQRSYLEFMRQLGADFRETGEDAVTAGERIFAGMDESFRKAIEAILQNAGRLEDISTLNSIRGRGLSSRARFNADIAEWRRLMDEYPERTADIQAEINDTTQQFWSEQLSAWSGALGFLADRFGGFFNYLSDLVNGLQQAQQFGSSVQSIASAAGATSSTASAAGAVGGTAAVFAIVYDIVDKAIKASKTRKYGTEVEFNLVDDREGSSYFNETGKAVIKSIRDLISGIEEALSISIEDLQEIGVKVRNDGERFKSYFQGQLLGTYGTLDEALEAALGVALRDASTTIRGLSDLMAQGLDEFTSPDFGELIDFLGQLREISDLSLSAGAIETRELTRHLDQLWDTLERLRQLTPAVAQGFEALVFSETRAWQAWLDTITGRQKTNAEILEDKKRELVIYKSEIELRKIAIKQRLLDINATLAALRAGTLLIGGGPGPGGGGPGGGGGGILGVARAFAMAGNVITQTAVLVTAATSGLSQAAIDMIALLEKEADAYNDLLEALNSIVIPDPSQLRLPRGGGGSSDLDNVQQFIEDKTFELAARGMSDYAASVAELMRQYDTLLEQAGRDITQRAALIDLREQELALMRQEQIQSTVAAFRDFLGLINPFDQIRETAADLIRQIEDSPFGDARKARMIGRVMAEVEEQIERMSRELAGDLLGSMIGDLEQFGADEKILSEARRQLAIIEHTLRLEHYRTEIAILRAEGDIAEEVLRTLEDGLKFLASIDPTTVIGSGAGGSGVIKPLRGKELADAIARDKAMVAGTTGATDAAKDLADALKRAADLLQKYHDDALDPLTRDLIRITGDFKAIREAFGDTSDVMQSYSSAVARAIDNFLDPIRQVQQDLFYGDQSPFDVMSQWQQAQIDLAQAQTAFRAGDLRVVEDVPELVQRFLGLAREIAPVGSQAYKTIFTEANRFLNEVLALSPEDLGSLTNPMTVAGMSDVVVLSEAQLDALDRIYNSSQRVAAAVESLNTKLNRTNALQNVA